MATCELRRITEKPTKKNKKADNPIEKRKFMISEPKKSKSVDLAPFLEVGQKYYYEFILKPNDVITDMDGWADAEKFRPTPYALVLMRVKRKNHEEEEIEKTIPGWWTGGSWDGKSYERKDKVLYWKSKE